MKIALFTYSTKLRGSVVHTLELAEALHEIGHEVCVYALSKDGSAFDYPLSCRMELIPAQPAPSDMDALIRQRIREMVDYLAEKELDYDIYHAQDCLSANALAQLRSHHIIPHFIRTVHHIENYRSPYLQDCQNRSIREADLCVCVSDRGQAELREQYRVEAPRVLNGINLRHFSPIPDGQEAELKQRWQLYGSPLYLTVGGVEPRKNSMNLLKAFALVKQAFPTAQLIIVGGETLFDYQSYRNDFFALADQLSVADSLILPGVVSTAELAAWYRLADAFVFPSVQEGWGLVVLEAIATCLPVITSNQAPFTEFLTPQQALLANPLSPAAIAQAMQTACQPEIAQSLIQHSQSILPYYTWKASADLHLHHYQQLVGTNV